MKRCVLLVPCAAAALWIPDAQAYIGPGAGFAFAGSFLVLIATFALAFFTLLTYPLRLAWRWLRVGNPYAKAQAKRVIILGLNGMDPGSSRSSCARGACRFQALADKGVFRPLDTSVPSMSPVAWSTFATGVESPRARA